jgi:hypothetical protein
MRDNRPDRASDPAAEGPANGAVFVAGTPALVLGVGLLMMAIERETPLFWRNSGGYPVWLRMFVLYAFYPALLGYTGYLTWVALLAVKAVRRGGLSTGLMVLLIGLWFLHTAIMLVVLANNLVNLMDGRPVHWHSEMGDQ